MNQGLDYLGGVPSHIKKTVKKFFKANVADFWPSDF